MKKKYLTAGRVAFYLLLLTVACTLVLGVTYSRFSSQINGAATAETASVALDSRIDLSETLKGMAPGEFREVALAVTNQKDSQISEVAQNYTVTIKTTGNLPLTYTLTPMTEEPGQQYATQQTQPEKGRTIWSGGVLPYSETATEHTYTLRVEWPVGQKNEALADEIDLVTLVVDAQQALSQTS